MENRDVNMGKVIQKNSYDDIWKTFGIKAFYIFGNTIYAHIFYLYCKEKGIDCKIRGFVLSDIANLKDKRKKYMIHDLPIRDVNWLKQADRECSIFGGKRKTIHSRTWKAEITDREEDVEPGGVKPDIQGSTTGIVKVSLPVDKSGKWILGSG